MRPAQILADQWATLACDRKWKEASAALYEGLKREQNGLLLDTVADLIATVCEDAGPTSHSVAMLIEAIGEWGIDRKVMPTRETPIEEDDDAS